MTEAPHFTALALQLPCPAISSFGVDEARAQMMRTLMQAGKLIGGAKKFIGPDTRLVVLPEYFMTGYPMGESLPEWSAKAAIDPDGPEYEILGKIASQHDVFLSGNAYETDANFPGLYFQVSFIIDPAGDVVLRYRRLISMFAPTPHDVWDKYLDIYGLDAVFPVADTALGKLACCASEEILYPEICRAHALRGAEIILHSTSEVASPELTPKDIAKRARAIENLVYVVSANSGGITGTSMPQNSVDGMSKIVDYRGRVLICADTGESMVANAELDLAGLRRYRRKPGMSNILARQRLEIFSETYNTSVYPANTLIHKESGEHMVPDRAHFIDTQRAAIDQLVKKDII